MMSSTHILVAQGHDLKAHIFDQRFGTQIKSLLLDDAIDDAFTCSLGDMMQETMSCSILPLNSYLFGNLSEAGIETRTVLASQGNSRHDAFLHLRTAKAQELVNLLIAVPFE